MNTTTGLRTTGAGYRHQPSTVVTRQVAANDPGPWVHDTETMAAEALCVPCAHCPATTQEACYLAPELVAGTGRLMTRHGWVYFHRSRLDQADAIRLRNNAAAERVFHVDTD